MALQFEDIKEAAARLGVEPCAVKAVVEVESAGSGFLKDGRPKILFEGHVFWKELQKRGYDPGGLQAAHPSIIYPKWTKAHYRTYVGEWDRLEEAKSICVDAALCSASWGLFQIMGYHYAQCGFSSVQDFVANQSLGEAEHLKAFCAYLQDEGITRFLAKKDWAGFARRYNGAGYAANQYDVKLEQAYRRCRNG